LLKAKRDVPAWVFLEAAHDDDKRLPVQAGAGDDVIWVERDESGDGLVHAIEEAAFDASDHFGWVACDNRTTRAVAKLLREDYKIPRKAIKAQAYWVA
jgi:NADPH-dependent ferric siderophore reductase